MVFAVGFHDSLEAFLLPGFLPEKDDHRTIPHRKVSTLDITACMYSVTETTKHPLRYYMEELRRKQDESATVSREEFEHLFLSYYETLCNVVMKITGDEHIAQDLVQDFFYTYWKDHRNKQFVSSFISYAYRSVKNRALNYLRDRKVYLMPDVDTDGNAFSDEMLEKDQRETKELLIARLEKEVENLPAHRRKIFLLSNRDGLKYREIAALLNISVNTVKTQLKLAYKQLRDASLILSLFFLIKILYLLHPLLNNCVFI